MTGGTLIVKKGDTWTLTKVAHDGYDLEERIDDIKAWAKSASSPADVCIEYLRDRHASSHGDFEVFGDPDLMSDDVMKCMYTTTLKLKSFEKALDKIEEMIASEPDADDEDSPMCQLSCSYCDYMLAIDMDKMSFVLNGEKI